MMMSTRSASVFAGSSGRQLGIVLRKHARVDRLILRARFAPDSFESEVLRSNFERQLPETKDGGEVKTWVQMQTCYNVI